MLFRSRLITAIAARPGQVRGGGFVSPAERLQMIEENLDDYRYIARTYLGRADGALFLEPLPDPDAAWTRPPLASSREIIEAIAAAEGWT